MLKLLLPIPWQTCTLEGHSLWPVDPTALWQHDSDNSRGGLRESQKLAARHRRWGARGLSGWGVWEQVLQWTSDPGKAQRLAWLVATCLAEELKALQEPAPGVRDWLTALSSASVPCALVAPLDRHAPDQ